MLNLWKFFLIFIGLVLVEGQIVNNCTKTCPCNEHYLDCGPDCQTTCASLGEPCLIRHIICPSGCYCNPGYARNHKGRCIKQSCCRPKTWCPKNEVYIECGPQCQNTCDIVNGAPCTIFNKRCSNACYCKDGFARADNNKCIPKSQCFKKG